MKGWSDAKEKAASVQEQSKIPTKPPPILMHKEESQSTFFCGIRQENERIKLNVVEFLFRDRVFGFCFVF